MTGLKTIEDQRAFEKYLAEIKEEPAYKLLEEVYNSGVLKAPHDANLNHRIFVYLTTGTWLSKTEKAA